MKEIYMYESKQNFLIDFKEGTANVCEKRKKNYVGLIKDIHSS